MNAFLRTPVRLILGAWVLAALPVLAGDWETIDFDNGWKFARLDSQQPDTLYRLQDVTLPHTFNAVDGQGGLKAHPEFKDGYYRGPAEYDKTFTAPASWKGRRVFVRFEAASSVAKVSFNGEAIGEHRGAFTAFCFELTSKLRFDQPNTLSVRVDNSERDDVLPLTGDFNMDGGIYRPVQLIITDPVCISPLDSASSGVYLKPQLTDLREGAPSPTKIDSTVMVSNGMQAAVPCDVRVTIRDAAGTVVHDSINHAQSKPLSPGETILQAMAAIDHPHLWNGRKDPYLYQVTIHISGMGFEDEVTQPLGLRTVAITNDQGFLLNGQPYPIHGVNAHQDFGDKGWAMTNADHDADMKIMADMGVTAIRLAHYPQSEYVHDLADREGILLWNEIPLVNALRDSPGFVENARQQLREMILQRYNHPSAAFWGMFNEIDVHDDHFSAKVLGELKREQKELDPSRINVAASCNFNCVFDTIPDWICYNPYTGWFTPQPSDLGKYIDDRYRENGNKRIGLSEYGAGANASQHEEGAPSRPRPFGQFHPEEYQAYVHEQDWAKIKDNPKLWGSFLWCMFDFASSHRDDGGMPGVNDKGLVTADRQTKKDAYFFYQANWSDAPMLHINGSHLVNRKISTVDVEVYSNCPSVELKFNGQSLGSVTPDAFHICRWKNVELRSGANHLEASVPGTSLTDQADWNYKFSFW